MDLLINLLLLFFGFIGALTAFGGETWRKSNKPWFNKITNRGWISLCCLLLALVFGIIKEVRNNHTIFKENERRIFLEKQLNQTKEQLVAANYRLKKISTRVEEVPRQSHSQFISVSAHGEQLLKAKLYGGDKFEYMIHCDSIYLITSFAAYYLNPRNNFIIIAGIRGKPMNAIITNKSNNACSMKGNVYSIR